MTKLTPDTIERFLSEDDGAPLVMLNLVRFKPDGGRERYQEYLGMAAPIVARLGGEILFAGDGLNPLAPGDGLVWDAVALVRYPNRRAFADLLTDPDYLKADPLRIAALSDAVLQPTRSL